MTVLRMAWERVIAVTGGSGTESLVCLPTQSPLPQNFQYTRCVKRESDDNYGNASQASLTSLPQRSSDELISLASLSNLACHICTMLELVGTLSDVSIVQSLLNINFYIYSYLIMTIIESNFLTK